MARYGVFCGGYIIETAVFYVCFFYKYIADIVNIVAVVNIGKVIYL